MCVSHRMLLTLKLWPPATYSLEELKLCTHWKYFVSDGDRVLSNFVWDQETLLGMGNFVRSHVTKLLWTNHHNMSTKDHNKIRMPAGAVTDWVFCMEAPGSPWPPFRGTTFRVPGSKFTFSGM